MIIHKARFTILALGLVLSLTTLGAQAMADPGKGKHKSISRHEQIHQDHKRGNNIVITTHDRVIIKNYLVEDYRSHCPPGLAKKHNGCLPPGQAKKYIIGQPLRTGIYIPVSGSLLGMLSPAPHGYQYVQVDKDVLLISEATKQVIDAVTLLSAVGH
jgi:hypothetical protein